jgi:predicted Ser/Thr protein kinase
MDAEVRTGAVVAGFRLESVLGEGATGTVYLAPDAGGNSVALKVLGRELADDERFRRRFLRESTLAASLDHANVVRVRAAGEEDDVLYLAMDYVEGLDLRELLRREGQLEPERTLELLDQVASALDAAHALGLVHRDVKPRNLLVADTPECERVYVCDFGLARHLSSASSLTIDRALVGTIDYIPPEPIEGGEIDGRADVYSLGCVLFECLAGLPPFDRDSELSVVFAHLNEPPPRLSEVRSDLPDAFDRVVAKALAKSPDDRYDNCRELVDAARRALRGEAPPRPLATRRRVGVAAAAAALTVAAIVAGALSVLGGGEQTAAATITTNGFTDASLGLTRADYQRIWGIGYRFATLRDPEGYTFLSNNIKRRTAYFEPNNPKAIELTTWNSAGRTPEGAHPCSTVHELKVAYGDRLEPVEANIINGKVLGYTVGKRLFFAIGLDAKTVEAIAIHTNPLEDAGFLALSEGPCL